MIEYFPVLIYIAVSLVLSCIILGLSFVFSTQKPDPEKISAYECGFDPFDDARGRFDIQFYFSYICNTSVLVNTSSLVGKVPVGT